MEKMYEVTGGIVDTPEKGNIRIPPEKTGRKDIEVGEVTLVKAEITPEKVASAVRTAKKNGITEIPTRGLYNREDNGR